MKNYLILLLFTLKIYSQEIEEIRPFYLTEISSFSVFYNCTDELNSEKLKALFKEISSLPKVNSGNSKFYKENGNSIFELYGEKNIRLKMIKSTDNIDCKIYLYSNGKVVQEIPYKNGKVNGIYKVFLSNGSILFETNFKDDKRNGIRRFYTLDHEIIEGNFINGQIVGKIKVIDNEFYNRYMLYPNNLEKGIIEYYDMNSVLYCEVPFINKTIVHGQVIYYYPDKKKRLVQNHTNGVLDGKTECFKSNGDLQCTLLFTKGKPIGNHKTYYKNGNIFEESFYDENGTKTGKWKTYDERGGLKNELLYKNGELNGVEIIYMNGFAIGTREYIDGKLNGMWKSWSSETKKLESERLMKDNKEVYSIRYLKNGKIARKIEFNSNYQVVKAEYYNKEGSVFYEEKYNAEKSSEGIHKTYMYDKNDDYFLYGEQEYNKKGFFVREKIFMPNEGYIETEFTLNGHSIKTIYKDNKISKEYYLYKTKKVSFEEFNKLDK